MRPLTLADVAIRLTCEPEDQPVQGNASCIDPETDAETERWILDQLDRGNEWGWCVARVEVTYRGLSAVDYLGGCSYRSEAEFRRNGYYTDMVSECLHKLNAELEAICQERCNSA